MTEGLNVEGGRGEMTGSFAPRGASEIFCEKGPRPPKGVFFKPFLLSNICIDLITLDNTCE